MSALEILRKACAPRTHSNAYRQIKWDALPIGDYRVSYMKLSDTNFGLKIYVYFKDQFNYVVMPPRVPEKLNQEAFVDELNKCENLWMKWMGKDKAHFNFLQIDFYQSEFLFSLFQCFFVLHFLMSVDFFSILLADRDGKVLTPGASKSKSKSVSKTQKQPELEVSEEEEEEADEADDEIDEAEDGPDDENTEESKCM